MNRGEERNGSQESHERGIMHAAHRELEASKRSVRELLEMRQKLFKNQPRDEKEVKAFREKAMNAINHLFNDELGDEENDPET